jgi:ABC-type transport system substrate-binding protein
MESNDTLKPRFATQVVPPPVSGYDPNFLANTKYDPAGAKALLDKFDIDRKMPRKAVE